MHYTSEGWEGSEALAGWRVWGSGGKGLLTNDDVQ